jgi:hypothetical protein
MNVTNATEVVTFGPTPDSMFNIVVWIILIGGFAFAGWQLLKFLEG